MLGDNGKLFFENKPVIERSLSKDNFKHSKGVKIIIKFKNYNYESLKGRRSFPNKAWVILLEINIFNKAENQKCNINVLGFNDYIDKHQCENANILPMVIIMLSKNQIMINIILKLSKSV
ncbi:hypothetical protein H8356DRAFT_1089346 [Neocallimastix lanati (nom. inval.)]|nr:hypothetical protein H8356DRAFT_1089346 [Neocallimastix sp. JGI-2020a]